MTTHKHLRNVIEDYYFNDCEFSQELLLRLVNELRYSNLYMLAKKDNGKPVFDIYQTDDGVKTTPLFTDLDEFDKFYGQKDIQHFNNTFELYRNVLKTSDIEGYVLNPASENYLIKKDFILAITDIPKTNYYCPNPYTPEELKELLKSKNPSLEEFIKKRENIGNFEGLFENLSKSTLFTLMVADEDLTALFNDGFLDMQKTGPVAAMYVDDVGGRYATIFSSKENLACVNTSKFKYAQVVNLSMLVNFVLSEDMDGIILNPNSDNVLIPRSKLLNYSLGFEKYANDEKLSSSIYYIFGII